MFNLFFGLIWTGFVALFTIGVLASGDFFAMLFMIPFWLVGIWVLKIGMEEYRRNKDTEDFGEECFGIITDIYESGAYVNDIPELKADMKVFVPSLGQVISTSEKIGLAHKVREYKLGTYVLLKFYNGDVNIVYSVDEAILPVSSKLALENYTPNKTAQDTIIIDGVEYVKKQ